ncbi:lectin subunit alpha-like [Lucilia sericata]|uniref:lectin subunit alpha-like n=1 Tax=Lucilia sericata TaxID=13632 RepID=UPI0018A88290|nr:lectin subunit alpha-like [Lucilia sericata]
MKLLFIILFLLTFKHRVFSITPEKLFTSDRNKIFYIDHEHKYDWFESLAKCARMDMSLTAFDSKVKWDDVLTMIQKQFEKKLILWTSGYAVGDKRQFMWMTTGEEFTFTNWTTGNPDFSEQKEYCVQIGNGPHYEWNDNSCTKKFGFICEFKEQQCKNYYSDKITQNYNFYFNKH